MLELFCLSLNTTIIEAGLRQAEERLVSKSHPQHMRQNAEVHIRLAHVDDATGIAKVHVDTWRTSYQGIVPDDVLVGLSYEQREARWRQGFQGDSDTCIYVAVNDGNEVIGFGNAGAERDGNTDFTGEIYALYVLKSYQGQGIGRRLVQACVQHLFEARHHSLLIWVLADNPARAFYEALGGKVVDEKMLSMGEKELLELAYGWEDMQSLVNGIS
ncbi:MAG: GNAT family N-acetyltransferase [Deinococcota bacterium]